MSDKICSLIGFAVKSGNVVFGLDDIIASKRRKYLIVSDKTLSSRSENGVIEAARKSSANRLISLVRNVEDIVFKTNCKVIAITDKQMANAIASFVTEDYLFINSEEL